MQMPKACTRCLCDTTISSIRFDESGVCHFCKSHDALVAFYQPFRENPAALSELASSIKASRKKGEYDCIVGVSGGTDSSFLLHLTKSIGLNPLAVHFDNGWNSDTAVTNIRQITEPLSIDLYTNVVDWEEFRDLQLAFLKAGVPCVDIPTDVGAHGTLYKVAAEQGIRCIIGGQSFMEEGTVPREWGYMDGLYVQSVHRNFGNIPFKTFPNLTPLDVIRYTLIKGIRQIPLFNYITYDKDTAKKTLADKYGWRAYEGHHYENSYTRFAFGWWIYRRFGIDKRKISLSGPIRSGRLSRERGLEIISAPPTVPDELVTYVREKLDLTVEQFNTLFGLPHRTYQDFFTTHSLMPLLRLPVKAAVKMEFFTPVLYEKYFA